jgi:hypothetical protein
MRSLIFVPDTGSKGAIAKAQNTVFGALLTEKKIGRKRVEDKQDAKFVEEFESSGISEQEKAHEK